MSAASLLAALSAAASTPVMDVPFSIFVCMADDMPTIVFDEHDDHHVVRYNQFGASKIDFFIKNPVIQTSKMADGSKEGWLITASGNSVQSHGLTDGTPAALTLGVEEKDDGTQSFSISVKAGTIDRQEAVCMSPPPPPVHLPEQLK